MKRLLLTTTAVALLSAQAFAATYTTTNTTTNTAAIAEAANASGTGDSSTTLVTPPNGIVVPATTAAVVVPTTNGMILPGTATTTAVVVPATAANATLYAPAAGTVIVPATTATVVPGNAMIVAPSVGAQLAARIKDKDLTKFRDALAQANLPGPFDPEKGYTIFAITNSAFDSDDARHIDYYVVNDLVTVDGMAGASQSVKTMAGNDIRINRTGSSYYVDDKRVNDVHNAPGGVIYTIGGSVASANLSSGNKSGL